MEIYKFSKTASEKKPNTEITNLLERAMKKENLCREEKDRIVEVLYGTFGSQSHSYKLGGWKWNMSYCLKEYWVRFKYGQIQSFYAPDKTSLRKVLKNIDKIVEVK